MHIYIYIFIFYFYLNIYVYIYIYSLYVCIYMNKYIYIYIYLFICSSYLDKKVSQDAQSKRFDETDAQMSHKRKARAAALWRNLAAWSAKGATASCRLTVSLNHIGQQYRLTVSSVKVLISIISSIIDSLIFIYSQFYFYPNVYIYIYIYIHFYMLYIFILRIYIHIIKSLSFNLI